MTPDVPEHHLPETDRGVRGEDCEERASEERSGDRRGGTTGYRFDSYKSDVP